MVVDGPAHVSCCIVIRTGGTYVASNICSVHAYIVHYLPIVQPIPVEDLVVEDVDDVEAKVGGSFRGSLNMSSSKCVPAIISAEWIAICISKFIRPSVEESS